MMMMMKRLAMMAVVAPVCQLKLPVAPTTLDFDPPLLPTAHCLCLLPTQVLPATQYPLLLPTTNCYTPLPTASACYPQLLTTDFFGPATASASNPPLPTAFDDDNDPPLPTASACYPPCFCHHYPQLLPHQGSEKIGEPNILLPWTLTHHCTVHTTTRSFCLLTFF